MIEKFQHIKKKKLQNKTKKNSSDVYFTNFNIASSNLQSNTQYFDEELTFSTKLYRLEL